MKLLVQEAIDWEGLERRSFCVAARSAHTRRNNIEIFASVNPTPRNGKALPSRKDDNVLQTGVSRTQVYRFRGKAGCFALLVR